ncbi:glycosyltransferase [Psychroflexus sp. MBR-150]|jgi:glycosyltransferase involved in cell wall biosynthesis
MLTWLELTWLIWLLLYFVFDLLLYLSFLNIPDHCYPQKEHKKLSVIIAAKNEANLLKKNLPFILKQHHPEFEIVIVNDQSDDETLNILKTFAQNYSNLKIVNIKDGKASSKKNAVQKGIEIAKYEHLVFTDADCKPLSHNWLSEIQHYYKDKNSIILGFSPYQKKRGFLNQLIRFETFITALNYFAYSNSGMSYMGVGRNLAYTKSLYNSLNGFKSHQHILSGDDDLFINQASASANFRLCLNPKTYVESQPETSFKSWLAQKRRHITTAPHYKVLHKYLLAFQYLTRLMFWGFVLPSTILFEIENELSGWYISLLLVLLCTKMLINRKIFKKLLTKDLWLSQYFLEIILVLFQFYLFMFNLLSPKKTWS